MNNKFLANLMVYIYATLTGFAPVRLPYASFVVNNIVPLRRIERLSIFTLTAYYYKRQFYRK